MNVTYDLNKFQAIDSQILHYISRNARMCVHVLIARLKQTPQSKVKDISMLDPTR